MVRLDHIAWRVKDRQKTAQFFIDAFDYRIQDEFEIKFDVLFEDLEMGGSFTMDSGKYIKVAYERAKVIEDYYYAESILIDPKKKLRETSAQCIALEPPEKTKESKWVSITPGELKNPLTTRFPWQPEDFAVLPIEYHLAPEIFVSDGKPDSIVGKWVTEHGNGIHHMAYQVDSVEDTVRYWREKGFAEFSSDDVIKCPGITQIFTKPSELTGVIFEFIERGEHGFCKESVKQLMESTK